MRTVKVLKEKRQSWNQTGDKRDIGTGSHRHGGAIPNEVNSSDMFSSLDLRDLLKKKKANFCASLQKDVASISKYCSHVQNLQACCLVHSTSPGATSGFLEKYKKYGVKHVIT